MGKANLKSLRARLPFVVFFGLVYLYLWLWVDPSLLYHGAEAPTFPAFSSSLGFFKSFFVLPGGPIEYLAALVSQAYYYSWSGALMVTAMAALLGWAVSDLMAVVLGRRVPALWCFPALVVLALANQYKHRLGLLVGVLVAVGMAGIYVRMSGRSRAVRLVTFLACSGPLYYIVGQTYILYALLCGIVELGRRRGWPLFLCYAALAGALPGLLGPRALEMAATSHHADLLFLPLRRSELGENALLGLGGCLLAAVALAVFWGPIAGAWLRLRSSGTRSTTDADESGRDDKPREETPTESGEGPQPRGPRLRLSERMARPSFELLVALIAAISVAIFSFDGDRARMRRISRAANKRQWPEVLWEARSVGRNEFAFQAAHATTRALFELDRLPYEMFSFPQLPGGYLLAWGSRSRRQAAIRERLVPAGAGGAPMGSLTTEEWYHRRLLCFNTIGELTLQLGLVNDAEKEAYEALEVFGEHPAILARLAAIHLTKDQAEAARQFLEVLRTYVHYGDFARKMLRRLEADPDLSADQYLKYLRSVRVKREAAVVGIYLEDRFASLLRTNKHNRMAFEYQMAFYLLNLLLEDFVEQLDGLDAFDYPDIPRHYEEALLIYEDLTGEKVDLRGRQISPQTHRAYRELTRMLADLRQPGSRQSVPEAIAANFGNTYFYYYLAFRGQL